MPLDGRLAAQAAREGPDVPKRALRIGEADRGESVCGFGGREFAFAFRERVL